MKTKIIYISGNEIFDMNDIRAAFEEVRNALNLDKNTVLFGVPVDFEDAGLMPQQTDSVNEVQIAQEIIETPCLQTENIEQPVVETEITVDQESVVQEPVDTETTPETTPETEQTVKKRGRPRKETIKEEIVIETPEEPEQPEENIQEPVNTENIVENNDEEKVVPILSVLSVNEDDQETTEDTINQNEEVDIITEISEEETIVHDDEQQNETIKDSIDEEITDSDEEDLEKLLSAMAPLQEDVLDKAPIVEQPVSQPEDISVDATLQQLASEFAENQDKIASSTKSSSRSKIGKLRNILPFKQSKHKDQGLGDLFGWAGVAANDEEFGIPEFFPTAAKK